MANLKRKYPKIYNGKIIDEWATLLEKYRDQKGTLESHERKVTAFLKKMIFKNLKGDLKKILNFNTRRGSQSVKDVVLEYFIDRIEPTEMITREYEIAHTIISEEHNQASSKLVGQKFKIPELSVTLWVENSPKFTKNRYFLHIAGKGRF